MRARFPNKRGMAEWNRWAASIGLALAGAALFSGCQLRDQGASGKSTVVIQGGPDFVTAVGGLDEMRVRFLEGMITRDREALQRLMTPDFVWREDESPLAETAFEFWDRHKLWATLETLLRSKMVRKDRFFVAPVEAVQAEYQGPRLAWRMVGSEWRLAHFYAGSQTMVQAPELNFEEPR